MSANPGWYADPTETHALRYWNGSVWTDDVVDRDVKTRSALDVASLPAPEVTVVEPSDPAVVPVGSPPGRDVHVGVWILLAGLGLGLVAIIVTADARLMRLWFDLAVFISVIAVVAVVMLVSKLVMEDRRRAGTTRTDSPGTARRSLRRRSTPSTAQSPSAWLTEDPPGPTDDVPLDT
jgi:hypothetical protein